jgi:hypothetical protein
VREMRFWKVYFTLMGIKMCFSTSSHPQTDGQTEVVNETLETYLRCFRSEKQEDWMKYLPWAEWCYNTSFHTTMGMTPYEAVYGKPPPQTLLYKEGTANILLVDKQLRERDEILRILKRNIKKAQNRMKQVYNNQKKDREFQIGDWVWFKRIHHGY